MEDIKQKAEFRTLLRKKLTAFLKNYDYELSLDNQNQDQSIPKNWVFRLQYLGKTKIEIFNDDWRDYTEYFKLKINDKEIFVLNLNNYKNIEIPFEELTAKLIDNI
ncbi:MAG: hypothetical protein LCH58_00795 [Bacteroidetes bacterium]|uniref:hypothetical protein n=1 Tax=Phnomibacter sp. TaxID=2836217 RepID=UPI002FDE76E9|nr:hypothetical protein [Bacteroidota bacterium]MCC6761127.1 hypothetical protein [Chitinophagaceae bacterium]